MKSKLLLLALLALQPPVFAADEPAQTYLVHEWGTFTSVQGADGIQMVWNPFVNWELPAFVYELNRPSGALRRQSLVADDAKSAFASLQRLETPVLYFYSQGECRVDVKVRFPEGRITEWYPRVNQFGPFSTTNKAEAALSRQSFLRWDGVHILPRARNGELSQSLPVDKSGSHYFAARATDADFLRVETKGNEPLEQERFLFYRGVGYFQAPLQASLSGTDDDVYLANPGKEELAHVFLLRVRQGRGAFSYLERLPGGGNQTVKLNSARTSIPLSDLQEQIGRAMQKALVQQGLFEREAVAMVNTWRDSWFGEEGLRVFYLLPRSWTDRTLPLTLSPKPGDVVRVMVARAELITPTLEWELLKQIVKFSETGSATREQAVAEARKLGLGRFTEPAVRRVLGRMPSREFRQAAHDLLSELSKPSGGKAGALAQR
jgi:hypothetical protein